MSQIITIHKKEVPNKIIERDKLFNVYLLGLPRSGTSMTTRILELLGVNIIHNDSMELSKNRFGKYHKKFYEIRSDRFVNYLNMISTPYSGCKMIIPINRINFELIKNHPCKVILMLRNFEEIKQSQMKSFSRIEISVTELEELMSYEINKLQENNIDYLQVQYRNILNNPVQEINGIKEFIKSDADITEAVKWVDPEAIHFKIEDIKRGKHVRII